MLEAIEKMRKEWAAGDAKRDAGVVDPDLDRYMDIAYGQDALQVLDVYCPKGTTSALPTIINVHGGGWFYGDKQLYSHYCMRLAQRGFTVVNFSYRLAPEYKYPAPLEDTCSVLAWVKEHAAQYYIDLNNLFMLGDSAGGQLCLQTMLLASNPAYRKLFAFGVPEGMRFNACALNCGCYFIPISRLLKPKRMGAIFEAYFPEDYLPIVPQLKVKRYITKDFPPAFVMTAQNDYLKFMAAPVARFLRRKGVETEFKIYGTKAQKEVGHVFHVNCHLELAKECNDAQCAFFKAHVK